MEVAVIERRYLGNPKSFSDGYQACVGASEGNVRVRFNTGQWCPNPSASIVSMSSESRPELDAPRLTKPSFRRGLGLSVASSSRRCSGVTPRRTASAVNLVTSSSTLIAMSQSVEHHWFTSHAFNRAQSRAMLNATYSSANSVSSSRSGLVRNLRHRATTAKSL
jgi:hypothetical protein